MWQVICVYLRALLETFFQFVEHRVITFKEWIKNYNNDALTNPKTFMASSQKLYIYVNIIDANKRDEIYKLFSVLVVLLISVTTSFFHFVCRRLSCLLLPRGAIEYNISCPHWANTNSLPPQAMIDRKWSFSWLIRCSVSD